MTSLLFATIACMIPLVLFLAGTVRVRGWKNEAGRAVMLLAVAGLVAFGFNLMRQLGYLPPAVARVTAYGLVAGALWWLYLTFVHVQHRGIREERRRLEHEELRQNR